MLTYTPAEIHVVVDTHHSQMGCDYGLHRTIRQRQLPHTIPAPPLNKYGIASDTLCHILILQS